jgi:hypothetical protein
LLLAGRKFIAASLSRILELFYQLRGKDLGAKPEVLRLVADPSAAKAWSLTLLPDFCFHWRPGYSTSS